MAEQGFTLFSPEFEDGAPIPLHCTCDGRDKVPHLKWMHAPEGTQSFAMICEDPDAPNGTFTHWVNFNMPADVSEIDDRRTVGTGGKNDFQADRYGGPCPPANHGKHRYYFRLFALDVPSLDVPEGAPRETVESAMKGHVLESTELMGTYERTAG